VTVADCRLFIQCSGTVPCQACVTLDTQCVIDEALDGRRKVALTRKLDELIHHKWILEGLLLCLRHSRGVFLLDLLQKVSTNEHQHGTVAAAVLAGLCVAAIPADIGNRVAEIKQELGSYVRGGRSQAAESCHIKLPSNLPALSVMPGRPPPTSSKNVSSVLPAHQDIKHSGPGLHNGALENSSLHFVLSDNAITVTQPKRTDRYDPTITDTSTTFDAPWSVPTHESGIEELMQFLRVSLHLSPPILKHHSTIGSDVGTRPISLSFFMFRVLQESLMTHRGGARPGNRLQISQRTVISNLLL
jgi:hypothetical protein